MIVERTGAYDPTVVVTGAIGPYADFCGGTAGRGASGTGYVTGLKLAVGITSTRTLDEGTSRIVSGDRCRVAGSYIGQTNLLIATSYSGLDGVVWGLDLAVAPRIGKGALQPLFLQPEPGGSDIPVLPIEPLLEATRALVGTRDCRFGPPAARRFPPYPGVHLVAAYKSGAGFGPGWVWSVLALAILEDRNVGSNLFNEDGGIYGDAGTGEAAMEAFLQRTLRFVASSIVECGRNHGVRYGRIYMGAKALFIPSGYYGCAIACGPYLTLAQRAVPRSWSAADLCRVHTAEWEKALNLPPLGPTDPVFLPPGETVPGGIRLVTLGCSKSG
ncbi:histidine decarboxylase, pyruvoyl type [Sphingomonas psychrotolerans]|uniref:histidine decarboxylase n=1 Tax=Sphingomonas psychrotolerans TaxID=1327635 RepID=A0ABU3MXZ6_9SPHN|nr:histidine decarboxylase, pyruvoyl type [Sphingomonas psychrotolerans]MDT8757199.1 histidine decarboxylase, pyruvoyl type [Sphingomonas psychrotolerans]